MTMRGLGFGSLALALGILSGCAGDDGSTGDDTTEGGDTTAGTTAPMMTTMAMTTMSMDDGVDDDGMNTTGGPPATTTGVDDTTGEPPADSGTDTGGATDTGGMDTGTGGGGLNCEMPADECETCACDSCPKELEACAADEGCAAIRDCAAKNDCTGAGCLGPCGDVINMFGGPFGDSAALAGALSTCVEESCGQKGQPCAP